MRLDAPRWATPPVMPTDPTPKAPWRDLLMELYKRPGEWAIVAVYEADPASRKLAGNQANRLRRGRLGGPWIGGDWETTCARQGNHVLVYARWQSSPADMRTERVFVGSSSPRSTGASTGRSPLGSVVDAQAHAAQSVVSLAPRRGQRRTG